MPTCLINCDKSVISSLLFNVNTQKLEVVASLQFVKRGSLVTTVIYTSPTGHYISPLRIFPRNNMKLKLMNYAQFVSTCACHPSGSIQSNSLCHFIIHVKLTLYCTIVCGTQWPFHLQETFFIKRNRKDYFIVLC